MEIFVNEALHQEQITYVCDSVTLTEKLKLPHIGQFYRTSNQLLWDTCNNLKIIWQNDLSCTNPNSQKVEAVCKVQIKSKR